MFEDAGLLTLSYDRILIPLVMEMPRKAWYCREFPNLKGNLEKNGPVVLSAETLPSESFVKHIPLGIF